VSVIVPVFDSERFLPEALDSIAAQGLAGLELLVVDDGSATGACEDITAAAAQRSEFPIRYLRQDHRGAAAARNRGVMDAQGEFVAFLDSDDLYQPGKLTLQLEILRHLPHDYGFVTGGYENFIHDAPADTQVTLPASLHGDVYPALLELVDAVPWTPGAHLFRRAALIAVGGYDRALSYGEDKDLLIRLARRWKGMTHRDVVFRRRLHRRSASLTIEPMKLIADVAYLNEQLRAADSDLSERLLQRTQQDALLSAARLALHYPGNHARVARLLREALRHVSLGVNWSSWRAVCVGYAEILRQRLRDSASGRLSPGRARRDTNA
jgi:glycosyltransferase involved in cell wall biosynthesis